MRPPDVESGMKALVEASPDTVMQIIAERQPILAKRIQDEPDPEKAKQLMLQAEDIWDDLIYMLKVTSSGKDAKKKLKNLIILYDQKRWNRRKGYNRFLLIKLLIATAIVFSWFFSIMSDDHRELESDEQHVALKGWELKGRMGTYGSGINFILIDAAREADRMVYDAAIKKICRPKTSCTIWFWSDETKMFIPRKLQGIWDMTGDQKAATTATYEIHPRTNYKKFRWNCEIVNDPNNCWRP